MPTFKASVAAARDALPQRLLPTNVSGGTLRFLVSEFINPTSGGAAVGDYISWCFLPKGARILPGSRLNCTSGAAGSTVDVHSAPSGRIYMPQRSVASTSMHQVDEHFWSINNNAPEAVDFEVRSIVSGAALQGGQRITLFLVYVDNN